MIASRYTSSQANPRTGLFLPSNGKPVLFCSVLFYSILFYSILFYSILFSSVCAKAQLQQERTGTEAVSNFSHLSICIILNDWSAFWSRAAILPHCQTKLGGEDPCVFLSNAHPLPTPPPSHTHMYAFGAWMAQDLSLVKIRLLGGEAIVTGKKRELWRRHRLY